MKNMNKNNKNNNNSNVTTLQTKGEVSMGNQTATKEVMNEVETIKNIKASNENDVTIIKHIVEGTIKKSEAAAEISKLENETAAEIAETEKEKAIEIAKIEAEAKVKLAEEENERIVKIAEMENEAEKQRDEWNYEAHIKLLGINERIDARKAELAAKVKIVENITDAVKWVAGAGALTAIVMVNTGATKEIQLEKIRQGLND
jgi:hypothetical protein